MKTVLSTAATMTVYYTYVITEKRNGVTREAFRVKAKDPDHALEKVLALRGSYSPEKGESLHSLHQTPHDLLPSQSRYHL